jgi:hypothetical protein
VASRTIDLEDAVVGVIFTLAAAASAGFFPADFPLDLAQDLIVFGEGAGSVGISPAKVIAVGCLLFAFVTNRTDRSDMTAVEVWTITATVALVLSPVFVPIVESILIENPMFGLISLAIQSGGYFTLGYLG